VVEKRALAGPESFLDRTLTAILAAYDHPDDADVTSRRTRVLLVDDSHTRRDAVLGALGNAGFETVAVGNVAEALDTLSLRRFDVVIADYLLPQFNGLELLAAIKNAALRTPLILYSGSMTEALGAEAQDSGVAVMLETPISVERLVEAVRSALPRDGGRPASGVPR
jgi:DNA-binding NtrC family response regulator